MRIPRRRINTAAELSAHLEALRKEVEYACDRARDLSVLQFEDLRDLATAGYRLRDAVEILNSPRTLRS